MYTLRTPFNRTLLMIAGMWALIALQPLASLGSEIVPSAANLPLSFVVNAGQTEEAAQFQVRSLGGTLFFTQRGIVLSLPDSEESQHVLRMRFEGANPEPTMRAGEQLPGVVNYFLGNDPTKWQTNVPTYAGMVYESLYPGIDLTYDGSEGLLKGTYTVAAGADLSVIRWRYAGAEHVELDTATGDLRIALPNGNVLAERGPTAWQEIGGVRVPVATRFTVADDERVGFAVGAYDAGYALTIDPVLVYSTFLGGTAYDSVVADIALDPSGNIYVVGQTQSTDFPTLNPAQGMNGGDYDVYVTKLNPTGTSLIYSTYLGGTATDRPIDLVIDGTNNVYVSGLTFAGGFPTAGTPNPFQSNYGGEFDGFVFKLSQAGNSLVYSTYLGGSGDDSGEGITVDAAGNAYITGYTDSLNFPTMNPIQGTLQNRDAFIIKLTSDGSASVYSTLLGGGGSDGGSGVAVDADGNAYVTGNTTSTNFPMAGTPYQNVNRGGEDGFVTKVNAAGTAWIYSTYLGGGDGTTTNDPFNQDSPVAVTVDDAGNAYVAGYTGVSNFPLLNAYQNSSAGEIDIFVTKLNSAGSALIYSTYIGGTSDDFPTQAIVTDAQHNVYIGGTTYSTDFPTVNGLQTTNAGFTDVIAFQLSPAGSTLVYSTHLGSTNYDTGRGIAVNAAGNIYLTGETISTSFPIVHPLQVTIAGGADAFISIIASGFTVNTTDDTINGTCDAAHCSLREAINTANVSPGPDAITFNIPGAGPHTIQVGLGGLPVISDPVVIDGATQPGYVGTPLIVLDGGLAGQPVNGLMITSGSTTVRGLVINNFTFAGILLSGSGDNVIEGNYIGTDATGMQAHGNRDGIYILESANNRIGGTAMGTRNIISGNEDDGINLEGSGSTGNQIHNNYIGTTANGSAALGNAQDGIKISGTSSNNLIGWTMLNIIAYNGMRGVYVEAGAAAMGNAIRSNTITSNGELGVDLGGDGVTQNDVGDGDIGSNNLQNSPTIAAAVTTVTTTRITGQFTSIANNTYYIEFFLNETCDASGFGEGESRLGGVTVVTDATGNTPFVFDFPAGLNVGYKITATATNLATNDTSEFSACATVRPPGADLAVTQTDSPEAGPPQTPVTYTIIVTNNGPDTASGVTLTDDLPDEVNFTSATPSQGNCSQAAGIVTCNLGELASGANAIVTVILSLPFRPTAVNQVSVNSSVPDPNPSNNMDTETTTVIATPTATNTPSRTYTPSDTPTPLTATPTATNTQSFAPPVFAPPPTLTPSDMPVPSDSPLPSATPTATNTAYLLPTATPSHTPLPPPPPIG